VLAGEDLQPGQASATDGRQLRKELTSVPAAAIIVAGVIGTGVFVKAKAMVVNVETPAMVLLVYLVAGLLTLAGSLVYSELSTMMPRSGGQFNYIGAAFGRRWAFLSAWTGLCARISGTAAVSILTTVFLNDFLGGTLSDKELYAIPFALITLVTLANLASVRAMGWFSTMLTLLKSGLILLVAATAFLSLRGTFEFYERDAVQGLDDTLSSVPQGGFAGFGAAMLGALWSYSGWAYIATIAGEVKNPSRALPRALLGGTATIVFLYLLVNAAYFYVLTPLEVAHIPEGRSVAGMVMETVGTPFLVGLLAAGLFVSAYGTLHNGMFTDSRLSYSLAKRGLAPKWVGRLSRRGVPTRSVVLIGLGGMLMAATGSFDVLTDMCVFITWIFFAMSAAALFILRKTHPDAHRPYRVWGYPYVPALYMGVILFLLVNTFLSMPGRALAGCLLVLAGVPVYAYFARKLPPDEPEHWLGAE